MLDAVIAGLVSGASYALLAAAVTLLTRFVGVLNFSLAAIGAFGAYSTYDLAEAKLPLWLAVCVGLLVAVALSATTGFVFERWFGEVSQLVRAIVSAVVLVALLSLGFRVFGDSPRAMPHLLPTWSIQIAGVQVSSATIVALLIAFATAITVTLLLRSSRLGAQLRAFSERPITLQLLGVNTRRLSFLVWAATGVIAALAMLIIAPTRNPSFESLSLLIVPALAAALIGGFSRIWVAVVAGLAIGAIEGLSARVDLIASFRGAIPFVVILVTLVWLRRKEVWADAR